MMKFSFPIRIYLIALLLRLVPVFLASGLGIGLDDMFQYDMLARSLASGHGFRWYAQEDLKLLEPYVDFDLSTAKGYDPRYGMYTSFRAPLYPAFLAVVYFFSGTDFSRFFAARLAQAIFLGAPLAPLTYLVSRHLLPDSEKTAKISAWIVACYPMLLVYPLGLGTENPFFVLLLASFFFLLKSIKDARSGDFSRFSLKRLKSLLRFHDSRISNPLLSGIFLALTALTRSVILPFALVAFFVLFFRNRRNSFVFLAAFFFVIFPWVVRNSLLHHKLTGIETSMGYNLYLGYHPKGNGSFIFGPSLDLLTIMDDAERDEIGTQKALGFIQDQPERFFPLALNRLGFFFGLEKRVLMYFYSNNIIGFIPKPILLTISAILLLPFVLIATSAMMGLSLLRWKPQTVLLLLLLASYLLPHVFILSEDRFHLALVPYFAILATWCWENGYRGLSVRWNESAYGKLAVTFAALGVALLLTNWGFELLRDADKIAALLGPDGNKTFFPY